VGSAGAVCLARHIPADTMMALQVGVVGEEFQVENTASRVIYHSGGTLHDEGIAERPTAIA